MSAAILPFTFPQRCAEPLGLDAPTGRVQADLVVAVQQGSHEAMEALFRAYFSPLVRFARSYLASIDEAEELVATLFARLWERREQWAPRHTIESYLFAAARNEALNIHRAQRRAERREVQIHAEQREYVDLSGTLAERDELLDTLRSSVAQALSTLPETARVIIEMRWGRQMSYEGIAEVLGGTPAAIQRQHSRTIARLRELVAGMPE